MRFPGIPRRRAVAPVTFVLTLAVVAAAAAYAKGAPKAAPGPPPVEVNHAGSAQWSQTTHEAAASPANKQVLASGRPVTVTGEVVDVSCYLQLGKRGEAHVACGTKCLEHGQPVGIVDARGTLYLLFAEEHHPRRDGEVDIKKTFIPLLAKTVRVTGMETTTRGVKGLFVETASLATPAPAEEKKD